MVHLAHGGSSVRPLQTRIPSTWSVDGGTGRISVMPDDAVMPLVWHLPPDEALAVLGAAGIPTRVSRAQSRTIPEGQLISVAPRPGTAVRLGEEAVLTVSCGPPVAPRAERETGEAGFRDPLRPSEQ